MNINLALVYERAKRLEEAVTCLENALAVDPDDPNIRTKIDELKGKMDRDKEDGVRRDQREQQQEADRQKKRTGD